MTKENHVNLDKIGKLTDIKAILFDFYGVIKSDGQKAWLAENGYEFAGRLRQADDDRCAGKISRGEYLAVFSEVSGKRTGEIYDRMVELAKIDPTMIEFMAELKKSYKLGLLTNSSDNTRKYIEQAELDKLFDEMVFSHEVGMIKPDRKIYEYALKKLAVKPEQVVFIDDKPENVAAAKKLGIRGIIFKSTKKLKQDFLEGGLSF
jgi:putative hydrolase of the HAD superfamily